MPSQGIYKITNTFNGLVYIGQSVDCELRIKAHKRSLIGGYHDNPRLQRSWNKYGESFFLFDVIEIVECINNLTVREQFWMDDHNSYGLGGYNICPAAGSCMGVKRTKQQLERRKKTIPWNKGMKGKYKLPPASEERKNKIGIAQIGEKNHNYGKKTPLEVINKIRISNCGSKCYLAKLTEDQVKEIKISLTLGVSGTELSRKYNVAKTQISAIKHGKTWRHVIID